MSTSEKHARRERSDAWGEVPATVENSFRRAETGPWADRSPAAMSQEDSFGKFVDDGHRLEAVKLRERRLLIHGLAQLGVRMTICLAFLASMDSFMLPGGSLFAFFQFLRG